MHYLIYGFQLGKLLGKLIPFSDVQWNSSKGQDP